METDINKDITLEEAADEYQSEAKKHILDGSPIGTAKDAFIAGAEWQKRKMMEGAVEGVFSYTPYPTICLDDCNDYTFKDGDDALIIIFPKED